VGWGGVGGVLHEPDAVVLAAAAATSTTTEGEFDAVLDAEWLVTCDMRHVTCDAHCCSDEVFSSGMY
jgi:hypothetical protein